jgi:hypothetical protein
METQMLQLQKESSIFDQEEINKTIHLLNEPTLSMKEINENIKKLLIFINVDEEGQIQLIEKQQRE